MFFDTTSYFQLSFIDYTFHNPLFTFSTQYMGNGTGLIDFSYSTVVAADYLLTVDCTGKDTASTTRNFRVEPGYPTLGNSVLNPPTFVNLIVAQEWQFNLTAIDIYHSIP